MMSVIHRGINSPSKTNSTSYDDQSDRKTLEDLIDKLFTAAVQEKPQQNSSPNSCKYKQFSMLKFRLRSTQCPKKDALPTSGTSNQMQTTQVKKPEMKKTTRSSSKKEAPDKKVSNGKISKRTKSTKWTTFHGWLSKFNKKAAENSRMTKNVKDEVKTKKEVLVESPDNNKILVKKGEKNLKRQSSGSFAKYGMHNPTFGYMCDYQKKFQNQKQYVESFNITEDSQVSLKFSLEESEELVDLDCKYLNKEKLKEAFERNYEYVYDIFHGNQYSVRHERFKNQDYKDHFTCKDLKYGISVTSFTPEQKQQLMMHLHEKFENDDDLSTNNQYFYKVLLPELCLKIFMDVHNMSYEEATDYLEETPIEFMQ